MIYDFDYLRANELPKVVIIGSGPAGISLSKKLSDQGISSIIIESGGQNWTPESHDTTQGKVVGDHYWDLSACRLKYFGGTSNHWAGFCRHFDDIDFEKRDDIPGHVGWPIKKADLDPFYKETTDILEIGDMGEENISRDLNEVQFMLSGPVRFAEKYSNHFQQSNQSHICFGAHLMRVASEGGRVNKAFFQNYDKEEIAVDIDTIIFATGGIDNSRILLWSNENSPEPVVKNPDTLGKYWFEHPHDHGGEARIFTYPQKFIFPLGWSFFSPTLEAMKKYRILNACLRLRLRRQTEDTFANIKNKSNSVACIANGASDKELNIMGREIDCSTRIDLVWQQEPRKQNKVELSTTDKDVFGVPRPVLHWKKSELDYRTSKVMMELLGKYLVKNRYGVIKSYDHIIEEKDYPPITWMAGCHHMGGTRMASSASEGVVDKNLKIFGSDNAYIVGSSVFPTSGHANPTFTIVQLALRLADHLGQNKEALT